MLDSLVARWNQSAVMRWYQSREPQERPVIAGLAAVALLSLVWLLFWKPLADWQEVSRNRYSNAHETWEWVQANEARAREAARGAGPTSGREGSLLPLITRLANSRGLTLSRLQPEADGAVSVVLQAQPFNLLLQWLDDLERQHSVVVQRVSLDAEGRPGLVNAQLRLQ